MSVPFHEVRLPVNYSKGARGGAMFFNKIIRAQTGREQRNALWTNQSHGRWQIAHLIKTPAQSDALNAFFRNRYGDLYGFRFKDWTDFTIPSGTQIGTGDGATTVFQISKPYSDGVYTVSREIKKPVSGTVTDIEVAGVPATFTVDYTTGEVTITSGTPTAGQAVTLANDVEFDVPVRFDFDAQEISYDTVNVRSWANISLVALPPAEFA